MRRITCRCCKTFSMVRDLARKFSSFTKLDLCDSYIFANQFFLFSHFSALILFSVCGLLAVTGSWLMSGLYLSTSVAVGDLCIDPAGYLVSQAPPDLPTEVLLYYTQCESIRSNPFTLRLRESQNAINNARSAMNIVSRYVINFVCYHSL